MVANSIHFGGFFCDPTPHKSLTAYYELLTPDFVSPLERDYFWYTVELHLLNMEDLENYTLVRNNMSIHSEKPDFNKIRRTSVLNEVLTEDELLVLENFLERMYTHVIEKSEDDKLYPHYLSEWGYLKDAIFYAKRQEKE